MSYTHKLQEGFDQGKTVCIGLDPSLARSFVTATASEVLSTPAEPGPERW